MKIFLSALCLFLVSVTSSFSQVSVEGVNIDVLDINYCKLVGYNRSLFGKVIITVDYGQEYKFSKTQLINGPSGRPVGFSSMVEALNFMDNNGWEYVDNSVLIAGNDTYISKYILRRKLK
jgi:hypothetical protein